MSRIVFLGILAGCAVLFALPRNSCGQPTPQTYNWNVPAGGAYGQTSNWLPSGIPDSSDETAQFALNSTYTVQVGSDYTVGTLVARNHGNVTLAFMPSSGTFGVRKIYNTTDLTIDPTLGNAVDLAFTVGDVRVNGNTFVGRDTSSGQANLTLVGTNLSTAGATVGHGASSAGRVVIDDVSLWNMTGPLVLGGAGDAELEIRAAHRTNCFLGCVTVPTQGDLVSPSTIVADGAASNAVATIRGNWNTGDFTVGKAGTAEVTLLGTISGIFPSYPSVGVLDSTNVSIGAQAGSSGTVHMVGLAPFSLFSDWDITGSLVLGGIPTGSGGKGRLDIELGNDVSVGTTFRMWPAGTLALAKGAVFTVGGTARLAGTLEFTITDGTDPELDDTFQLFTANSVVGTFTNTLLPPLDPSLDWSVQYTSTNVSLKVVAGPNGDFNNDGIVDAADYVVWRKGVGIASTPANYNIWRANFGSATGSGTALRSTSDTAVPEPASRLMLILGMLAIFFRRRTVVS